MEMIVGVGVRNGCEQPLAFDDPWSNSDTMVGGCSPACSTPQVTGLPQDVMKVHA